MERQTSWLVLDLPPEPDAAALPRYGTKRQLADIHRRWFGPISERSLERWPLDWKRVNGLAVAKTADFLAIAEARFQAEPPPRHTHHQPTA
jgi:hypothetical protein